MPRVWSACSARTSSTSSRPVRRVCARSEADREDHRGLGGPEEDPRDHGVPAPARRRHGPRGAHLQDLRRRCRAGPEREPLPAGPRHPGHRLPYRRSDRGTTRHREDRADQWPWDADRVEVECWGSGAEQAHIYTIVVDGRRYGASVSFRDGTFRFPEQGAFGAAAELAGVELDERLGGPLHRAAREVCGA